MRATTTQRGDRRGLFEPDISVELIGPYAAHWSAVSPTMRLSLTLYIAVLVYSGGLAIVYLLINLARVPKSPNAGR